jgi:hypothetical protein
MPLVGSPPGLRYSLSGNGRYVAFYSTLDTLVPGDTNGDADVHSSSTA